MLRSKTTAQNVEKMAEQLLKLVKIVENTQKRVGILELATFGKELPNAEK